jgi:uncharacterized protein (TIGR03382 family)
VSSGGCQSVSGSTLSMFAMLALFARRKRRALTREI